MKKAILFFVFVLLTIASAFAQTATLSYQAVVRDSHNKFVRNTDIDVDVSISVEGTERYFETRTAHTNQNGVVSFSIGGDGRTWPVAGHPSDDLASITGWRNATISVTFHLTDGDVTTNSPVSAVPYALEVNPTLLPTVNDATLTIQKNGTTAGTFTANQATDQTVNITVPTCDSLNDCDLIKDILNRLDRLEQLSDSLASELDKMKPSLTVTGSLDTVTVCSGSTHPVTYTATFHNCSSSDYTIVWKVNGTDSSNVTTPNLTLNAEAAGDYEVICVATRSDNSSVTDTTTTHVEIDTHVPSFTATVNLLTVSLSDIVNTATIQWDMDSVPVAFSGTSAEHTYSVADTITITATNANGCTFVMGLRLQPTAPTVTTDSIPTSTIAATMVKAYGTVTSDGGLPNTKRGMVYSTSDQNLKIGTNGVDSVMDAGTGKGNYACDLKRLTPCTQYYVRAFAINDVDTVYGEVKNFTTLSFTCGSTLTDIDGNEYETLLLGSQCWMKQNLRTTHFADGTEIPVGGVDNHSGARRYAPNSNLNTYGYLYNWDAAMNGSASSTANPSGVQGVCPAGWHLPSDAEWTQLTSFVASNSANVCDGNPSYIAKSLASTEGWGNCPTGSCQMCKDPSTNNSTGFSVLPAGTWHVNGASGHTGQGYHDGHTIFRTATGFEGNYVRAREFYSENPYVDRTAIDKTNGLSIRCVLTCPTSSAYLPTISTVTLSSSGATVSMTSNVLSDGGATVTERGVCWSTSPQPTTSSDHTADSGTGTGTFTVSGSLTPGYTYYVRAYATNSEGTAYGAEVTYVMTIPKFPPVVSTASQFLALKEGFEGSTLPSTWTTIDNDGDGKNWFQIPYLEHSGEASAASASFDSDAGIGLTPDNYLITPDITLPTGVSPILTFWYIGRNNFGDPYYTKENFLVKIGNASASPVNDFDTLRAITSSSDYTQATFDLSSYAGQTIRLAFVHNQRPDKDHLHIDDIEVGVDGAGATAVVSDITASTASCNGYVADDGGATVTARGVCWSTSQNPTVSDSHTTDGTGTGSFTSNITGLNALTTYYVRAYATNSEGTTYGNQLSFTTTEALPVVTTSAVSNITVVSGSINATCGGNVTDEGASAVTARGVCWSTSQNPTISGSHTTDGSGLGSFTSTITDLSASATYYVRAYATNSAGTAYGNQVSFTTPLIDTNSCPSAPVVTDHEGNMYATVLIGTLCWMRENLRTTTSPKTGTYLVKPGKKSDTEIYSSNGSKVAYWFSSDSTTYAPKGYGLLYNWCAAMDTANPTDYVEVPTPSDIDGNNTTFVLAFTDPHRGICPAGWHLPSLTELNDSIIKTYKGGMLADGDDWMSSSSATAPGNYSYGDDRNSTGFSAFPAALFNGNSFQNGGGMETHFWSTWQMESGTKARSMKLAYNSNDPVLQSREKNQALSVRCIKD